MYVRNEISITNYMYDVTQIIKNIHSLDALIHKIVKIVFGHKIIATPFIITDIETNPP